MQVEFEPDHALPQMRRRRITREQVEYALENYGASFSAQERQDLNYRCIVYLCDVDGRPLKVWVKEGTNPPLVMSAAWRDRED